MATGEVTTVERAGALERPTDLPADLAYAASEMPGGRISIAQEHATPASALPFSTRQLSLLDEALTVSSRETGLLFSTYLGDLGEHTRQGAEALLDETGTDARRSVLIAVSPGQRVVEIVTGSVAGERIADRACKLAVMSMVASFKEGDLIGGIVSGLRVLTEQAGG